MKNRDKWQPSKYVLRQGRLMASRDSTQITPASRLNADLVAGFYQENLPRFAHGRLLDLGCGRVPLFAVYRDYISENICVDWANAPHREYLDFECDLTQALPFQDGEFDTIILSDVLEHLPEPDLLWKEMARILSKGGRILLNVPFYYRLHETPHDYYRYTEFALRRFVQNAGLELLSVASLGGSPEVAADFFAKNFVQIPLIGPPLVMLVQFLTMAFIKTTLGKRVSARTNHAFPLGYFLVAEKKD